MSLSDDLGKALRTGDPDSSRDLLVRGANPSVTADGYPAICTTAMTGSAECVDLLASFDADVYRASHDACTAAMWGIGTLRRECFDHVIVLNEAHALRLLGQFLEYYHESRPHQSLGRDSPDGREPEPPGAGPVIAVPMLGGLHHRYRRAA